MLKIKLMYDIISYRIFLMTDLGALSGTTQEQLNLKPR